MCLCSVCSKHKTAYEMRFSDWSSDVCSADLYSTYTIREAKAARGDELSFREEKGKYVLDSDLYRLVIDPQGGGVIESLIAKKLNNKEYVDGTSAWRFNEIKGYFGKQEKFISSADQPARIRVVEQGDRKSTRLNSSH